MHPPGKLDEAAQLSSKIAEHRKQLDEYRQLEESGQGSGRPDHIDFRNPTDEQLRDAQKHGIDLRDPLVVQAPPARPWQDIPPGPLLSRAFLL